MSTRIVLADDHNVLRMGLRALLDMQPDMEVVGEAGDGWDALEQIRSLTPDIAILDIGMPGLNGVEATREIRELQLPTKVIALSMYGDEKHVGEMLKAGARGYLLKNCDVTELTEAVHTVVLGGIYLSPDIASTVLAGYLDYVAGSHPEPVSQLSSRERQVLQLVAEGRSTKEIAHTLNVSDRTVETHRHQIMEKLGMHSVAELTKFALREGITSIDH